MRTGVMAGAASKPAAAVRIDLNQVVIVADPALPVYVQHRVQDLRDYLAEKATNHR